MLLNKRPMLPESRAKLLLRHKTEMRCNCDMFPHCTGEKGCHSQRTEPAQSARPGEQEPTCALEQVRSHSEGENDPVEQGAQAPGGARLSSAGRHKQQGHGRSEAGALGQVNRDTEEPKKTPGGHTLWG